MNERMSNAFDALLTARLNASNRFDARREELTAIRKGLSNAVYMLSLHEGIAEDTQSNIDHAQNSVWAEFNADRDAAWAEYLSTVNALIASLLR